MTRVDQVETLLGAEKRKQTKGARSKTDDVIRREVTRVLSVGTVTDDSLLPDHRSAPLMVLCEVSARVLVCKCVQSVCGYSSGPWCCARWARAPNF